MSALLLLLACASATSVPKNRHGLEVIAARAVYDATVRTDTDNRLADVSTIPAIVVDVRYATPDNFMKRPLYPVARAFLRAPAAAALRRAQAELEQQGLGLKVFDAYRPYRVTEQMWELIRNPDYVADPKKGSRHNRGAAVDVTLVDLATGRELPMPTGYDSFEPAAAHAYEDLPEDVRRNRALLRSVMEKHGFDPLPSEWWHYDFRGWEKFHLLDIPLEQLP